jgi:preprotein translocase subunit SecD
MNPNLKYKVIFIVAVVVICVYFVLCMPTFPTSWAQVKSNFASQIKLGLDLQGGTHLVLQVQVPEAIAQETDQTVDRLTSAMRTANIHYDEVRRADDTHVVVKNPDPVSQFRDLIHQTYEGEWELGSAPGQTNAYLLTMRPSSVARIQETTMQQSLETIERRINALGLTEPTIQKRGRAGQDNEILVQLPGESDPERAKSVIQAGGQLELKLVADPTAYPSEAAALAAHGGVLPPGTQVLPGRSESRNAQGAPDNATVYYVVERTAAVTGRDLRNATESRNTEMPGQWQINFTLSSEAGRRFGQFTEANVSRQMAIVLENKVYSAPVIKSRIEDQGRIDGNFSQESAHDLALVLRAGALPASIKYLEQRTVGASLGADSIRHGVQASVLSLLVVMIFMVIYYRLSGVNAVLALILNLIILLAALAMFGAVLTLPGIAGVILTIGMGVDSNVLVFERIREELRNGKSTSAAVEAGFDKAFLTIIDTHVTTVVSAFFLFIFGTGPIRGFAITLTIGLIANVFTAIYVSKTIFQYHLAKMDRQAELSI